MPYRRKNKGLSRLWKKKNVRRSYGRLDDSDDFGSSGNFNFNLNLSSEAKKGIFIIVLFVAAVLSVLGLFDLSGQFGKVVVYLLGLIFGHVKWLVPIFLVAWSYLLLREDKYKIKATNYIGAVLLLLGVAGLFHLKFYSWQSLEMAKQGLGGGYVGVMMSFLLLKYLNFWGTLVVLMAVFLIGVLLTFETSLYGLMWPVKIMEFIFGQIKKFIIYRREKSEQKRLARAAALAAQGDYEEEPADGEEAEVDAQTEESEPAVQAVDGEVPQFVKTKIGTGVEAKEEPELISKPKKFGKKIELPLALLSSKSGKPTSGDIKANQEIIRKTLANFGIMVEMAAVNVGPTVTQYTLRPADGVKISRILNLNSDLALALAAHPVRIEAPIPGKSLVGIEIPNEASAKVTMNEMLSSQEFKLRSNNLSIALGKDVSGKPCFAQLDRMPHLLIAGATGSGKSVCINSIIVSLLYQNSPDELKFILVDPKRVELPAYNNIPYLLTPVITDVKKTINALKWTIVEMEKRFELLSKVGKRNIASYNQTATDKMPYIVFIIDELADLMASAASDMEAGVVRLAQMARAVGIHLILATQRPSMEVITGLIKANIPGRIAFSVASFIDSRTILDTSGAEKLVGRGDMLYLGPDITRPKRLQGVYLSDHEISDVIDFIKKQGGAQYLEELNGQGSGSGFSSGGGGFSDDEDPLLGEAMEVIRQSGKASASLLQRRLKLGYARAARILDILEERGVIGPSDGAKPREVFLDSLGGVDAVDFAAREHGLTGELVGGQREPAEDEPSFTAFTRSNEAEGDVDVVEDAPTETIEATAALVDDDAEEERDESEDLSEDKTAEEQLQEIVEAAEIKSETKDGNVSKKTFADDEWT
ncbi:MAG: DNA translocase FtsK 4TM domain-containing protein [Patescibacteria group bacterium]